LPPCGHDDEACRESWAQGYGCEVGPESNFEDKIRKAQRVDIPMGYSGPRLDPEDADRIAADLILQPHDAKTGGDTIIESPLEAHAQALHDEGLSYMGRALKAEAERDSLRADLAEAVSCLLIEAHWNHSRGNPPGDKVMTCLRRHADLLETADARHMAQEGFPDHD
jgi:hypothetical protein